MLQKRNRALDIIKGIAVILMLEQHCTAWFWEIPPQDIMSLLGNFPFIVVLNSLGGFAAPAFILSAGIGAVYLGGQGGHGKPVLIKRGIFLIVAGVAVNALTPSWFSIGSWYVLHLIGFSLVLAPLLLKLPERGVPLLAITLLALTALLQYIFETPSMTSNFRMADLTLPGGFYRLMFLEGHFPIFPWLSVFLWGIAAGRLLIGGKMRSLGILGALLAGGGFLLALPGILGLAGPARGLAGVLTNPSFVFYPTRVPLSLVLSGAIILAVYLVGKKGAFPGAEYCGAMGKCSLTVFIIHIPLFKELTVRIGIYQSLSAGAALAVTILIIALFTAFAHYRSRNSGLCPAEWLLRIGEQRVSRKTVL